MPPLPGPDWIPLSELPEQLIVQQLDQRLYSSLGVTSRPGALLMPFVTPVVPLNLEPDPITRSYNSLAFSGRASQTAVAANLSHVQLFNPAGSAVDLIITQIAVRSGTAGTISIGSSTAALANPFGGQANPFCKNLRPLVSVGENRIEALAALTVAVHWQVGIAAGQIPFIWKPEEPIVVEPGHGFGAAHGTVNVDVAWNVDLWQRTRV